MQKGAISHGPPGFLVPQGVRPHRPVGDWLPDVSVTQQQRGVSLSFLCPKTRCRRVESQSEIVVLCVLVWIAVGTPMRYNTDMLGIPPGGTSLCPFFSDFWDVGGWSILHTMIFGPNMRHSQKPFSSGTWSEKPGNLVTWHNLVTWRVAFSPAGQRKLPPNSALCHQKWRISEPQSSPWLSRPIDARIGWMIWGYQQF